MTEILVKKKDGRIEKYKREKIERVIKLSLTDAGITNEEDIKKLTRATLYKITQLINDPETEDPRITRQDNTITITTDFINDVIETTLMKHGYFNAARTFILKRKEKEDTRKEKMKIWGLKQWINDPVLKNFTPNALRVLASRYPIKDEKGNIIEKPSDIYRRVALGIAITELVYHPHVYCKKGGRKNKYPETLTENDLKQLENLNIQIEIGGQPYKINKYMWRQLHKLFVRRSKEGKIKTDWDKFIELIKTRKITNNLEKWANTYYELMINQYYMPNTPAIVNTGRELYMLSACFVVPIKDDMKSIMKAATDMALIQKSGGGTGFDFTPLRPEGDVVGTTSGVASGPVSFLQMLDAISNVIRQGGVRRGANMGVMHYYHPDIMKFIHAKENNDGKSVLTTFNLSVGLWEDFWEKLKNKENINLINPRNKEKWGELNSLELFNELTKLAWAKADPGVLYFDNINKYNIMKEKWGPILATNPCVTGNTRIPTPNGLIKIEELFEQAKQTGEKVELLNKEKLSKDGEEHGYTTTILIPDEEITLYETVHGNKQTVWKYKPVKAAIWKIGTKDTVKIVTKEGYEIEVSKEAKIMTENGKFVQAKDLKPGDKLIYPRVGEIKNYVGSTEIDINNINIETLKSIPEEIFKSDTNTIRKFIIKVFKNRQEDNNRIILSHNSIKFLKDLQILLNMFSVKSRIEDNNLIIEDTNKQIFNNRIMNMNIDINNTDDNTLTIEKIIDTGKQIVYDITVLSDNKHIYTPNLSIIKSNCGEEALYPYESCNLASINVEKFVKEDENGETYFDWEEYQKVIRIVTRFLDSVIDVNNFPIPELREMIEKTRRIGLGFMGVANTLFRLKIPYNSREGFEFMRKLAETNQYFAMKESIELAKERGTFPVFDESGYVKGELPVAGYYILDKSEWNYDWDELVEEIKQHGLRNMFLTTAPPTGSVSMLADTSNGIEPVFALVYKKEVTVGTFYYTNKILEEELKKRGLYKDEILEKIAKEGTLQNIDEIPDDLKRIFVTSMDIHYIDHIIAQAMFQTWTDVSISKTINMKNTVTVEDVKLAYILGWLLNLKGLTVYRDGSLTYQVYSTNEKVDRKLIMSDYAKKLLKEILEKNMWILDVVDFSKVSDIDIELNNNENKNKTILTFSLTTSNKKEDKTNVTVQVTSNINMIDDDLIKKYTNKIVPPEYVDQVEKVLREKDLLGTVFCPVCWEKEHRLSPLVYEAGCISCKTCGWSECTIA